MIEQGEAAFTDRAQTSRLRSGPFDASLDDARAVADSWRAFFGRFDTIVLVANSDAVDIRALQAASGPGTLFVFFNKVYKVLTEPFEGESLLVARSSPAGANIVYRREVPDVLRLLRGEGFHGIANLRVGETEVLSPRSGFAGAPVGYLDLAHAFDGFYPATHLPTSGFALALHLHDLEVGSRIVLAGFTARRSLRWKLFSDHDWTFEQIVLRLMERRGTIAFAGVAAPGPGLAAIGARLGGVDPQEVALVAAEVLAERLDAANGAIDRLHSLTRPLARLDGWFRRLKPATRKSRLAAATPAEPAPRR